MLALTLVVAVVLVFGAASKLRTAWKDVDAMIASCATPAAERPDRESAGV